MFHLFVNNVQCKHVIFGGCHDSVYTVALEAYASNPITASSITLLKSYKDNPCFESLPFDSVEFPRVFRATPFKVTDRLGENDYTQDTPEQSAFSGIQADDETPGLIEVIEKALAQPPFRGLRLLNSRSTWGFNQAVLLNIDDERVDPPPLEEDKGTSKSMKDRMQVRQFCTYYHLWGNCSSPNPSSRGQVCKFRHEPKLNRMEIAVLKNHVKKLPCGRGSKCRQPDCIFGHNCNRQPGCPKGEQCSLYKFHEVDPDAIKVWQSRGGH